MLLSKALTGGAVPVAVMATTSEIRARASQHPAAAQMPPFLDLSRGIGGPRSAAAAAAGAAAIEQVHNLDLPGHARRLGPVLVDGLAEAVRRHPRHLLDAPGIGLMAGLRCANPAVETLISMQMAQRGIHLGHSLNEELDHPVLRFYPPLIADTADLERVLTALEDSLCWLDRRPRALTTAITWLLRRQRRIPPAVVMKLNHSTLSVTW